MSKYQKYVFDIENRQFIGDFEDMYRNEAIEKFDSWHQDDQRQLQRIIDIALIGEYNFSTIVDIGCGKGAFTHLLKKRNNRVIGIDISETAIEVAGERYPDIEFLSSDISDLENFSILIRSLHDKHKINLVFMSEVLSYIENWSSLLDLISKNTEYLLISLFIPENPIGFVKSEDQLVSAAEKNYEIIDLISLKSRRFTVLLGRSKNCSSK